ncbi:hypothetical protein ACI2KR_07865 [Pseudomonas luteola]
MILSKSFMKWLQDLRTKGHLPLGSCPKKDQATVLSYVDRDIFAINNSNKRAYVSIKSQDVIDAWIESSMRIAPECTPARAKSIIEKGHSKAGDSLESTPLKIRGVSDKCFLVIDGHKVTPSHFRFFNGAFTYMLADKPEHTFEVKGKLYLIENYESWAHAERYLPHDGVYVHYQGWLSERLLEWLSVVHSKDIVLSPDYDLVGLHNWLRLKQQIPKANLFWPINFSELLDKHPSSEIWKKQYGFLDGASRLLSSFPDEKGCFWLHQMQSKGACLEQEILHVRN